MQRCLPLNFRLHYALKANANLTTCRRFARFGAAAVSSLGELITALRVGFDPAEIVFTGPGKTRHELVAALEKGVGLVVVESIGEARRLEELAAAQGMTQPVLLRVNPAFRTANSCEVRSDLALQLWAIPLLFASPIHALVELPEHWGCQTDSTDTFVNTRTILPSALMDWFTNGNCWHVEHHAKPAMAMQALPQLHITHAAQLKHLNYGYGEFYGQFWVALWQRRVEA